LRQQQPTGRNLAFFSANVNLCCAVVGNVWVGSVHNFLIGPYLLPSQLSAQIYWMLLEEMLPEFLEEFPSSFRRNMCFQQDGAAPHFAHQVQENLTATQDCWIGSGKPAV
jgi:hypothetical protein